MPALPQGEPVPNGGPLSDRRLSSLGQDTLGAYVHIPFCATRCGYCDFNTYVASELQGVSQSGYVAAVLDEVSQSEETLGDAPELSTVFIGGGTPTLLPAADIARILARLDAGFGLVPNAEVTIEANPESVTEALLDDLLRAGVNRISFGMQSAQPHVLAVLDRTHTPGNVAAAVKAARRSGFEQVSLDLIYGAPSESVRRLEAVCGGSAVAGAGSHQRLRADCRAGYAASRQVACGELAAPDDDDQATKYEIVGRDALGEPGFSWYEVSNWSRDEASQCRHNLAYWHGANWWGFGPGAHSSVGGVRWWNVKHPRAYIEAVTNGSSPAAAREVLDAPHAPLGRRHASRPPSGGFAGIETV